MVICTIIRMLEGICLRMIEIKKLENAVTKVNATHITMALAMLVVTASAEQIPRICRAMGLLSKIGEVKILLVSACYASLPFATGRLAASSVSG